MAGPQHHCACHIRKLRRKLPGLAVPIISRGKRKTFINFFPFSCLGFDLGICRLGFERDLMLASEMSGIVLSIPEHSYEKVKKTLLK